MRGEPRPVFWLVVVQAVGFLLLALWWLTLPPAERATRLWGLVRAEGLASEPPAGVLEQLPWLLEARWDRLQGGGLLVGLGALIGVSEGVRRRRQDVLGGLLLRLWITAVVALACVPGIVGGALLLPVVVPLAQVAGLLAGISALAGYGVGAGRPSVA